MRLRLLVLQPTRFLGNAVISLQTLAALTRAHDVDLVIDDRYASLIHIALESQCRVVYYPRAKIKSRGVLGQLKTFYRLVRRVRANRYDMIIDLDGTSLTSTIIALIRGRHRIGPGFVKHSRFYDQTVPMDQATQHCFDDFARVAESVNADPIPRQYLMLPELPHQELSPTLTSILNRQKPLACLHPSASKSYKEWPATQFASLSDALHERGYQVIILGAGDGERPTIDAIGEHTQHPFIDTHNQLDIIQLAWLIQQCHLYVGNDSGPMHLAAITGTKVVGLFGPTELIRWRPLSETTTILARQNLCDPKCQPEACLGNYRCMSAITLDDVLAAINNER